MKTFNFIKDNKVTLPLNEKKMSVNIYIREIKLKKEKGRKKNELRRCDL